MRNRKKFLSLCMAIAIGVQGVPVFPVWEVEAAETEVSQGQTLYNSVKADFQSVVYEDFFSILNPYVSSIEKLNTRTALTKELGRTPTDEEVNQRIAQIYLDRLDLRGAFEKVKSQLDEIMPKVLESEWPPSTQSLKSNKVQTLLGLTYLERYYSFSVNGVTAKDILMYQLELIGSSTYDALSVVNSIGNTLDYVNAKGNKTADVYENCLSWLTGIEDITGFVEAMAEAEGATGNEYLNNHSKAVIRERGKGKSLFDKMKEDTRLSQYLLPLLNLSSESIYVISTSYTTTFGLTSSYGGINDLQFQERLEKATKAQQDFLEFWQRISTTKEQLKITPELLLIDTMAVKGEGLISNRWSPEIGDAADVGVREFITPMGHYRTYMYAGAEASLDGNLIQFFVDHVLTDTGINTYTHELTHIYDQTVWLNGRNRRTNCGNETFARGLFESENNTQPRDGGASPYAPYFNLNTAYQLGDNRIQNKSPERFQTSADIQEYMHGVMDVLYTLDVIEAEEILKLNNADKALLLNRVSLIDDATDTQNTGRKLDCFTKITEQEAATLETIDDLVEEDIVSGRLIPKGSTTDQTVDYNEYVVVPMFEGVYAGLQNNNGLVGDFLFRRYTHELLAEYGWEDGMIAYASDQYANDSEALLAILDEQYQGSLKEFKKAMFQQRAEKMANLKPTATYENVEEMRKAIGEALQKDLSSIKAGIAGGTSYYMLYVKEVQNTKADIFKEYLLQTDDFRSSIYQENTTEPENPEETNPTVEVTQVTFDKTEDTMKVGTSMTLTATIAPDDATNKTLTWSSSDKNIATVENGVVTSVNSGNVVIKATAENGVFAQCNITVEVDHTQAEIESARQSLQETIEIASAKKAEDYTEESWQQFQKALTEVTAVKDDTQSSKQQLEDAKVRLEEAMKKLVEDTNSGIEGGDDSTGDGTEGEDNNTGNDNQGEDKEQQEIQMARKDLEDLIFDADTKKQSDYTEESWQQFQQVLTEVMAVKDDTQSSKQQLEDAKVRLEEAMKKLVEDTNSGTEGGDDSTGDGTEGEDNNTGNDNQGDDKEQQEIQMARKDLEDLIFNADTKKQSDYTEESWNIFSEVLKEAKELCENQTVTKEKLVAVKEALKQAMETLVLADENQNQGGNENQGGDDNDASGENDILIAEKNALEKVITDATSKKQKDYTVDSWNVFQSALQEAEKAKESVTATKEDLQKAIDNLKKAIEALKVISQTPSGEQHGNQQEEEKEMQTAKDSLQNTIQDASTKQESAYTKESFAIFQKALKEVEAIFHKPNATKEELVQAQSKLQAAVQGLQLLGSEKPQESDKELGSEKPQQSTKPGTKFEDAKGIYQFQIKNDREAIFTGVKKSIPTVKIANTIQYAGKTFQVTSVAAKALKDDKVVTNIFIGKQVKEIGTSAFEGCEKLKKIKLGNNTTKIGNKAFKKCKALTKVNITKKIKNIGKSAFEGCTKLSKITIRATSLQRVGKNAFKGISAKAKMKVSKKNLAKYKKLLKNKGQNKKVKIG